MSHIEEKLSVLGVSLPEAKKPVAAISNAEIYTCRMAAFGRKPLYVAVKYWLDELPLPGGKQLLTAPE